MIPFHPGISSFLKICQRETMTITVVTKLNRMKILKKPRYDSIPAVVNPLKTASIVFTLSNISMIAKNQK
jgi:hypothetical protein